MTNFLIMPKNVPQHFFYKPYEGICKRDQRPSGIWQEHTQIFEDGRDGFGVFADKDGIVHSICTNEKNELVYGICKNNVWKKHIISRLGEDIYVSDMRLYSIKKRLNLLYSATYNGEILLVHCILGDKAKPSTVDVMENSHFYIHNDKVFYTNVKGEFGCIALSDEKPQGFVTLYDNAHFGTVYTVNESERILYASDSRLFLDGRELIRDTLLETPIMVLGKDRQYIMWKSGNFIRYISSTDSETWNEPMRFMSNGSVMTLYSVQRGNDFSLYYGYHTPKDVVLLGNPKIFEPVADYRVPNDEELEKIKKMLNKTQTDIKETKKELKRLGNLISSLSG